MPEVTQQLLPPYQIPTPSYSLATTPDGAVQVAAEIGYPVVLKLVAKDVTHKTDVGGIRLNLKSLMKFNAPPLIYCKQIFPILMVYWCNQW